MTLDPENLWLGASAGVPLDRPFTFRQAADWKVSRRRLIQWTEAGLLINPLHGVYYAAQLEDSLELRLACLRLVVPPDSVVCDRTAGWLLGAEMILAPGDHLVVPHVSIYRPPGLRLRGKLVASGERMLLPRDVLALEGVRVTTGLRTACDLGRLLRRDQAFAAMDAMMRHCEFTNDQLERELRRFRGFRGIIQARELAPEVDGAAQSSPESILRRRWLDVFPELPRPSLQVEVPSPRGSYFLDLGIPELKYAAEYDGVEWHGPERREDDRRRRAWIRDQLGWVIDVFTAESIFGHHQDAQRRLVEGVRRARQRYGGHGPA